MQNENFRGEFIKRRHGCPGSINVSIFRFITRKNDPKIKLFCFVEGDSDIVFYKGIIPGLYKLTPEQVSFIINQDSAADNIGYSLYGKRSVIKMCDYILAEHNDFLHQCKFIIDRDYDDLDFEKYGVSDEIGSYVTILPCYSFENYYFMAENLQIIFRTLFGSMEFLYFNEFTKLLADFLSESCQYNALKRLTVKFSLHEKYPKLLSQFLNFNDDEYEYLISDGRKLTLNIEPLKSVAIKAQTLFSDASIYETRLLQYAYEQYCTEMREDPLIIKGKLLFSLLVKYINFNSTENYTYHDLYWYSNLLTCPGLG